MRQRPFHSLTPSPQTCRISAVTYVEAVIVADNRGEAMRNAFDTLVDEMGLIIEPVTPLQARIARRAYQIYGKGNNSKAKLNMGDCFAYALAKDLDQPLPSKATTSRTPTSPPHSPDGPAFPLPKRDRQGSSREYRVLL
ncbi:type II toxin-antitoxin system VapC family toxin [Nonomuraea antri]|uniref:type II toxin-antitoxin system VapC family toxin n=1 Tax=Nonomuraea antri TaxID=2730852 RepID=UPI001C2BE98E|nr:type II toxin-antitoxin system VapC family toxin [Nonomuraea antri]